MAVVKADGYGHGASQCAAAALTAGARWLGVARIDEALRVRAAGIEAPLLVLGPPNLAQIDEASASNITLTLGADSALTAALAHAPAADQSLRVHLKVDTGMRRYGFPPEAVLTAARRLQAASGVVLEGVYTHFARADEPNAATTAEQVARFERVVDELMQSGIHPRWVHAANSAGVLTGQLGASSNLARSGIATYGLSPSAAAPVDHTFTTVAEVRAPLGRVFTLEPGEGVSYGHTYHARGAEHLGTLPIGYADGLPRGTSNIGWVGWRDARCPIRGRICMDQTIVSVPLGAREGDDITVIGDGRGAMTVDTVAALTGTLNYEIVARLGSRLPRLYLRNGEPAAWSNPLTGEGGEL